MTYSPFMNTTSFFQISLIISLASDKYFSSCHFLYANKRASVVSSSASDAELESANLYSCPFLDQSQDISLSCVLFCKWSWVHFHTPSKVVLSFKKNQFKKGICFP